MEVDVRGVRLGPAPEQGNERSERLSHAVLSDAVGLAFGEDAFVSPAPAAVEAGDAAQS